MNKKQFLLGITSLATAGVLLIPAAVNAYRGDMSQTGPNHTPDRHQAMTAAFANNDYEAWRELVAGNQGRVAQVITRENFARFAEAHRLMSEGKVEEARQIRAELGLGLQNGQGKGQGMGQYRVAR